MKIEAGCLCACAHKSTRVGGNTTKAGWQTRGENISCDGKRWREARSVCQNVSPKEIRKRGGQSSLPVWISQPLHFSSASAGKALYLQRLNVYIEGLALFGIILFLLTKKKKKVGPSCLLKL